MAAVWYVYFAAVVLFGCIWLALLAFLLLKKHQTPTYLLFFTIFYAYLIKVLDYTLFQFQSLLIVKHFLPRLILRGHEAGEALNLIPLIALTPRDAKTSLLNVLLFVPFGLGLPAITSLRLKQVTLLGAIFSITIELLQWTTGFLTHIAFRIADINDVIFNTLGVAIGYLLFVACVHLCRHMAHSEKTTSIPVLRHIIERPQL